MIDFFEKPQSRPLFIVPGQIRSMGSSGLSQADLEAIAKDLRECNFNISLPLICVTENEDEYQLLTGLAILEAAKISEIDRIWAFCITDPEEAKGMVEKLLVQQQQNIAN